MSQQAQTVSDINNYFYKWSSAWSISYDYQIITTSNLPTDGKQGENKALQKYFFIMIVSLEH